MKKILLIVALLVIVVAAGMWLSGSSPSTSLQADSTETIGKELDSVDLGDLDSEFEGVNSDLGGL